MAIRTVSMGAIIAIAVTGIFLTVVSAGVLTASQSVTSSGTITAVNVGVYADSGCTQSCSNIDWGTLPPGNSTNRIVYVKNTGTVPVTLSLSTTNWTPSNANNYLTLSWDRTNYVLNAGSSIQATLTLTASSGAGSLTSFSFNVVITGTG